MRLLTLFVLFFTNTIWAEDLAFVRIRVFKDLNEFPKIESARIKKINNWVWSLNGKKLIYQNKKIAETNVIVKKTNQKFDLVSILEFNQYLTGVVASEMPTSWPMEALKAQAVVARSFALARIHEQKQKYFHLDSDVSDQVFNTSESLKAQQAVIETEGVVLQTDTGKTLKAYFHADCGGQTLKASEVWGTEGFDSGTAIDPWCAQRKSNNWSAEIPRDQFVKKLGFVPFSADFEIQNKAQMINFGQLRFSVQKIRQFFGFSKIKSSIDRVEINGDKIKFTGQGYGHGAGLCQWGTLAQVKLGRTYEQILRHYYPKATLNNGHRIKLTLNNDLKLSQLRVSN